MQPAVSTHNERPHHLDPSELGTREYWDNHYARDIEAAGDDEDDACDPSELESWFDDVDAPSKIVDFLTSALFPLSSNYEDPQSNETSDSSRSSGISILDLGTGNGSMLFTLRLRARFYSYMVGVDYSRQSIELARKLAKIYSDSEVLSSLSEEYCTPPEEYACDKIQFETLDVIKDDAAKSSWWSTGGFDLVLDKGTFDAISLSSETIALDGKDVRICELYPKKAIETVQPGGFLLITSCNWTEDEVVKWFTTGEVQGELEVFHKIRYPVFKFGGKKGQGVASVCFKRKERP